MQCETKIRLLLCFSLLFIAAVCLFLGVVQKNQTLQQEEGFACVKVSPRLLPLALRAYVHVPVSQLDMMPRMK